VKFPSEVPGDPPIVVRSKLGKDKRLADGCAAKTVKDCDLSALKSVFGWAERNHVLSTNPAKGVTLKVGKKPRQRPKGFTDEEACTVLAAALGYVAAPEEHSKTSAAKRWGPWLCAYTGARIGEIVQLRRQDVRREGQHWIITITPDAGPVKNKELREVPLHPHLVELGFPAFVEAEPEGYLFVVTAKRGDVLGRLQGLKNRISEFVRTIVADRRVAPNHGWRHRFVIGCNRR
jgi:integrase